MIVLAAGQSGWIPAQATVVQSHTTKSQKGSGFSTHQSYHFSYGYEVDGKAYTASRYSFWALGGSKSSGTEIYRLGDSLTIYHHSKRPEIAVVERVRPSVFVWIVVVFALVFIGRGVVMIKTGTAAG